MDLVAHYLDAVRPLLPATFVLDCDKAAGPVCMLQAAAHAIEIADKFGVGVGLVSDTAHTGAIGRYAHWIAERQTAPALLRCGTEERRRWFLPRIAAGECWFSLGMSEPDAGSDLASVRTAASASNGPGARSRSKRARAP